MKSRAPAGMGLQTVWKKTGLNSEELTRLVNFCLLWLSVHIYRAAHTSAWGWSWDTYKIYSSSWHGIVNALQKEGGGCKELSLLMTSLSWQWLILLGKCSDLGLILGPGESLKLHVVWGAKALPQGEGLTSLGFCHWQLCHLCCGLSSSMTFKARPAFRVRRGTNPGSPVGSGLKREAAKIFPPDSFLIWVIAHSTLGQSYVQDFQPNRPQYMYSSRSWEAFHFFLLLGGFNSPET